MPIGTNMDETPQFDDKEAEESQAAHNTGGGYRDAEPSFESVELLEALPTLEVLSVPTRIDMLSESIERYPEAPSNYVIRGEALLDEGQNEWAAHDFTTALQLAEAQARTANWGYIYQALYDRAQEGLRSAQA